MNIEDLQKSQYRKDFDNPYFLVEFGQYLQSQGIKSLEDFLKILEPSYFVVIPLEILERTDISASSKILYGEICALTRKSGECFATNDFLANRLGVGDRTIIRSVSELSNLDLIRVKISRSKKGTYRKIYLTYVPGSQNVTPPPAKMATPGRQNGYPNKKLEREKSSIAAEPQAEFNFKEYLKRMDDHKARHVQVISLYFKEKKLKFDTLAKAQSAIKRHLRAAKEVANFSDKEIIDACDIAKKEYADKWTIETVYKILTR